MTLLAVAVGAFVVDDDVVGVVTDGVVAVLLLCWFIQMNGIGSLERVKGKVVRYWCVGVDRCRSCFCFGFLSSETRETRPTNSANKLLVG